MSDTTELDEVLRRTREVEERIEATQARLDKLLGLEQGKGGWLQRWRDRMKVEARRELPPLEPAAAHEALVLALHRETGLVGAVRTRGDELTWKPYLAEHPNQPGAALEVSLEGGADAPALSVTSRRYGRRSRLALSLILGAVLVGVMGGILAFQLPGIAIAIAAPILFLVVLLLSFKLTRRIAQREHSQLVGRLADELSERALRVRVADVESEHEDEVEALASEPAEEELTRGLS